MVENGGFGFRGVFFCQRVNDPKLGISGDSEMPQTEPENLLDYCTRDWHILNKCGNTGNGTTTSMCFSARVKTRRHLLGVKLDSKFAGNKHHKTVISFLFRSFLHFIRGRIFKPIF